MRIRIEGSDLPGRAARDAGPGLSGCRDVHVGVQRRNRPGELLGLVAADAAAAVWDLECAAARTPAGVDVTGPYVQGRPGTRFVYLSWVTADDSGGLTVFRRAKLMLGAVPAGTLDAAVDSGRLTARLGLTDARGHPLCAQVLPPHVTWSAGGRSV